MIQRLHHRRVLSPPRVGASGQACGVLAHQPSGAAMDRVVHEVVPEHQEERPIPPRAQEGDRLGRQLVLAVLPDRERLLPHPRAARIGVGMEAELGVALREALLPRPVRRGPAEVAAVVRADVPLAEIARGVARRRQDLRERHLRKRQVERVRRHPQRQPGRRARGGGLGDEFEPEPRWGTAGQQGDAGGRADRGRGVGLGETRALPREPVKVRRVVPRAARAAEIAPAEVVREDDEHVGPRGGAEGGERTQQ